MAAPRLLATHRVPRMLSSIVAAGNRTVTDHEIRYVDVFAGQDLGGNPVAVVHDADGLSEEAMAAFARWTNLSETTFLLKPSMESADYRLRIFTPGGELPFAGHPTLGSCHAWLEGGGCPGSAEVIYQECPAGIIELRRRRGHLAFAAPPLLRSGPLDSEFLERLLRGLGIGEDRVLAHQWVDNGPGWAALLLDGAQSVLALQPDFSALAGVALGVVGRQSPGADSDIEVRAFVPDLGVPEDPVTGSLNAGLAQWLIRDGYLDSRYVAAQGTAVGRSGRVFIDAEGDATWVAGATQTRVLGSVTLP